MQFNYNIYINLKSVKKFDIYILIYIFFLKRCVYTSIAL